VRDLCARRFHHDCCFADIYSAADFSFMDAAAPDDFPA